MPERQVIVLGEMALRGLNALSLIPSRAELAPAIHR